MSDEDDPLIGLVGTVKALFLSMFIAAGSCFFILSDYSGLSVTLLVLIQFLRLFIIML